MLKLILFSFVINIIGIAKMFFTISELPSV